MSRRPPRQAVPATEIGGGAGAPRAKPVRLTSTLEPQTYRQLTGFCAEAADAIGAARVPHAAVVRALIARLDRKSTRLNSSHVAISYAVFCLKKKKTRQCLRS